MRVEIAGSERFRLAAVFGVGMLAGVAAAALFVGAALKNLERTGVSVEVETAPIAAQVQAEVRAAVRRELPGALAAVRRDIPRQVAADTARRLSEKSFNVGGFVVPVPQAAVDQIQAGVEDAMRTGLDAAIKSSDIDGMADRLSAQMSGVVSSRLKEHLANMEFVVHPYPWLSVPVRVVPR